MSQGPNAPYTALDQNQILQRVFDEDKDQLRVDATVTATIGEVIINAEDSNIAIKDPVSGNILKVESDGSIDVNVVLDAASDNVLVLGTEDGTTTGTKHVLKTDSNGNLENIQLNTLIPFQFDSIYPTYPDAVTEIYTYKQIGSTVAVLTVIYTDSTKNNLTSIVRT